MSDTKISDDRLRELLLDLAPDHALTLSTWAEVHGIITELLSLRTSPPPSGEAGEVADRLRIAVLSCPHTITSEEVVLRRSDTASGNALNQLGQRIRAALPTIKEPTDEVGTAR